MWISSGRKYRARWGWPQTGGAGGRNRPKQDVVQAGALGGPDTEERQGLTAHSRRTGGHRGVLFGGVMAGGLETDKHFPYPSSSALRLANRKGGAVSHRATQPRKPRPAQGGLGPSRRARRGPLPQPSELALSSLGTHPLPLQGRRLPPPPAPCTQPRAGLGSRPACRGHLGPAQVLLQHQQQPPLKTNRLLSRREPHMTPWKRAWPQIMGHMHAHGSCRAPAGMHGLF